MALLNNIKTNSLQIDLALPFLSRFDVNKLDFVGSVKLKCNQLDQDQLSFNQYLLFYAKTHKEEMAMTQNSQ